jgi:monofunctional biosynthetic peptidoglycan transglycosylase
VKRQRWPRLYRIPHRYKPNGTSRYVENQSERIYQIMVRRGIVIPEYDDVISEKDENNSETSVKEKAAQGEQSTSSEPLNTENKK